MTMLFKRALKPKRTSPRSPWQNGVAERWVGSCWREILDHVIDLIYSGRAARIAGLADELLARLNR